MDRGLEDTRSPPRLRKCGLVWQPRDIRLQEPLDAVRLQQAAHKASSARRVPASACGVLARA
eukprot:scaffold130306_cov30-Tisochrysis_lutea.AAC.1